jgi:hypothetical protein
MPFMITPTAADIKVTVVGGAAAGGSPTYLLSESWDGSTACGDGSHSNCDNTWGVTDTTDFNYQAGDAPLEGTNSAFMTPATTFGYLDITYTANDEVWYYLLFNAETWTGGTETTILEHNDGSNSLCTVKKSSSEKFNLYSGGQSDTGTVTLNTTSTYSIWLKYVSGDGANAQCELWVVADSTTFPGEGNEDASVTNSNETTQSSKIWIGAYDGEAEWIMDHIRIDDVAIGSAPE